MINLLPPEEKQHILLEKKRKIVTILSITLLIPLLCLALLLLSIRFYLLGEINTQNAILEQAKKDYQTPDFLAFKTIIQSNNATISELQQFYAKDADVSDALKVISSLQYPTDVYLTNLSVTKDKNNQIAVIATGVSKSRDDLLVFQKSLQAEKQVKSPYFSPESWVDPINAKFYLTFQIIPLPSN